jgi:phosphohistidine swiveling domain-containing protein
MTSPRSIDTAPHPDFRCYSTGNFGEIAPERWSIMSWSLVGDPVERGLRAFTRRLWPSARWATGSHYVFVGYFACRPYHNLSALCQIARELPGIGAADVTRAYFEGTTAPPSHVGIHANAVQKLLSLPRMAREFHRLRPRLRALEGDVALCEEQLSRVLASGSLLELGRWLERAARTLDQAWDVHYSTTSALVPASALQRALGERRLQRWDELEPLVTRPRDIVWSRLFDGTGELPLTGSRFLELPFYEVGDAFEPWRSYARAFAPHAPQEVQGPAADDLADVAWQMLRGASRLGIQQTTNAVADSLRAREDSKALAMRCLHSFRLALPSLAEEAGLTGDAWTYLRIDELLSARHRPLLTGLVERRREEVAEALAETMPDRLVWDEETGDRDAPTVEPERRSSGVSPGVVAGVVATLADVPFDSDRASAPIVLVCESADAGVQTLLPSVGGLITRRGSMLSHISTLAREYGIPAVVNHPLAGSLRSGQHVVLNGSTGEVEVIA